MRDLPHAPLHADLGKARDTASRAKKTYPYVRPADLDRTDNHYRVVIVGGGPVGLALSILLARYRIETLVLERLNTLSAGSRAICWSKRSLEICDALGVGDRVAGKGVTWNQGMVYAGESDEPVYTFDLLPDKEQKYPAFVNLQQFYTEEFLVEELEKHDLAELRWRNNVVAVEHRDEGAALEVETPDGNYHLTCDHLIAVDGHRSPVRNMLGLGFEGRVFEDNFLIADVKMEAEFPAIRRFWFDPPFNPGQTALLHKQADGIWRIDFQMGWDVDREAALAEENVDRKVRAFLGDDVEFEYDWVSIYTFQCRRMSNFVHGRVIFAGDAAHLVSPFGARGANGGLQDADNLAWKLAYVLKGLAPAALLETYDDERVYGADENIRNSSRSTDFMTPKSEVSAAFRDAVLELARDYDFARRFVNSGRLSVPCVYDGSPLNTPDEDDFTPQQRPGSVCMDAPVMHAGEPAWLLNLLGGAFVGMWFADDDPPPLADLEALAGGEIPFRYLLLRSGAADDENRFVFDAKGLAHKHYDARPGTFYLIRPDQVVAARWRAFDAAKVAKALDRALGKTL